MKFHLKSFIAGFIVAYVAGVVSIVVLLYFVNDDNISLFQERKLPSGRMIKVISFNLAWGSDHDTRMKNEDCFALEYVSSAPDLDTLAKNQETLEVFEMIRLLSEMWKLDKAVISVFPFPKRKGAYDIYSFQHNSDGTWTFDRRTAKVHVND
ncbi:MAG: hypothetical protein WCX28_11165 [Bacteriovoracaceae bacterium]|nr:hypothetical protein [Bacteroidota bacterium]